MVDAYTEPFSAGYELVRGVNIVTWAKDRAVMDPDLYRYLAEQLPNPLLCRIDDLHYEIATEGGVPADTVAVPHHNHKKSDPSAVLVMK